MPEYYKPKTKWQKIKDFLRGKRGRTFDAAIASAKRNKVKMKKY